MTILCVSDWIDPLIYSERLKERMNDVDIIVSCGDVSLNYLDFIMSQLDKPLFFVFGNHVSRPKTDTKPFEETRPEAPYCFENLHLKVRKVDNVLLTGFQGSLWYNGGPYQYRQWQVYLLLLKLLPRLIFNRIFYKRFIDIFVTHASPFKIGDLPDQCHRGLKAFNLFIKLFKPKLVLHGHIHIYDRNEKRTKYLNDTKIINCSGFVKTQLE
jgi:Icc-related predicted phosphoesterase